MTALMTITEKLFALKAAPPFDRLRDGELALLADAARVRRWAAGEIVGSAGESLRRLYVVIDGRVLDPEGATLPRVFGVNALLFHRPLAATLSAAAPEGATCLLIQAGHFHTAIHECPGLLTGFLERV
jgi:signal-transduction protein with cAMP-binding, CBS, and nucleotidyltransferase domain